MNTVTAQSGKLEESKMVTIRRYSSTDEILWNQFNLKSKNSLFMFDRNYMDYHKDRFIDHSLLFFSDDELIAILPLSEKEGVFYSHGGLTYGGFISDEKMKQHMMLECFTCLREYCRENGIEKIIYKAIPHIYHKQPAEEDKYALYCNGAHILKVEASTVINLKEIIPMAKLRLRQIKKAVKNGVAVSIQDTYESYDQYINLLNTVLNERHNLNAVHTTEEMFLLHKRFPEKIRLYVAAYQGEMVAGTIVYIYDTSIHTQYLSSIDVGRSIGALDLVIKTVIEDYADSKNCMDFGISTEDMGHILNYGLISQKEGFGGRTEIYETWEMLV